MFNKLSKWISCFFLVVLCSCSSQKPENVIVEYFRYFQNGDLQAIQNLMANNEIAKNETYGFESIESIYISNMNDISISEEEAVIGVEFQVQYKKDKTIFVWNEGSNYRTFVLKKKYGKWKIHSIGNA